MMFVTVFAILLQFVALNEKRTMFLYNGKKYNRGELVEIIYKHCLGFIAKKDSNGSWRDSADIPQTMESVKSMGFSLCCEYLGDTKQEILDNFFAHVYADYFTYIVVDWNTNIITCYKMDRTKFYEFLKLFGTLDYDSKTRHKKIRIRHETKKMLQWLTENAGV